MRCPRCGYRVSLEADHRRTASIKEAHEKAFQRWKPEDEKRLRQLASEGKTPEEIAEVLGRQTSAIVRRAELLMVKWAFKPDEAGEEGREVVDYL